MKKKPHEDPYRYYLPTRVRHVLWENEIAMFIVLVTPVTVASFWYGATINVTDQAGHVLSPALLSRGLGLGLLMTLFASVAAALYLFVQPAVERVRNAQPVRGRRRLVYSGFDGLLVGLVTYQSLPDTPDMPLLTQATSFGIAAVAALMTAAVAFIAMHSMVDLPTDQAEIRPQGTNLVVRS